jgi:hypothetical protein
MMREKDVVKADFSVLIIMCFERLGVGGRILRILSEDSRRAGSEPIPLGAAIIHVDWLGGRTLGAGTQGKTTLWEVPTIE